MTNMEAPIAGAGPAQVDRASWEFEHKALVEIGKMLIGSFIC